MDYTKTIISNFGDDYIESPESGDLRYQCPHCKELGKRTDDYKLFVSYRNLVFHCFRCDWKGKLAYEELVSEGTTSRFINTLSSFLKKEDTSTDEDDNEVLFKIPVIVPDRDDPSVKYLESRGISYEDVVKYNMRVPTNEDPSKFLGRIVIPNRMIAGKWTDMYSARTYVGSEPKYLNPKNSPRARIVFNLHNQKEGCDQIIINEGVLTSIVAGYDSVATYGKSVTDDQINQIIAKKPKRIYVSLDNDAKPEEGIMKDPTRYKVDELVKKLLTRSESEIYLVEMPPDKDAVDVGRDYYRNVLIKNAIRIKEIREYELYSLH